MEYAYTFGHPPKLYLNPTNRCTNRCAFCIRNSVDGIGGWPLHGDDEPDLTALLEAVETRGGPGRFSEIVWCGFGEPTFRLDLITAAASQLRRGGARVRLNTNGHACLIHRRDVLPELARAVDAVSVSLNAPDRERYLELCRPDPELLPWYAEWRRSGGPESAAGDPAAPAQFWLSMLDFLERAPHYLESVQASVVGSTLAPPEIEECRRIASSLGIPQFRVR